MKISVTQFRVIYAIVFILIAVFFGCPLTVQAIGWIVDGKWFIGIPLLILLLAVGSGIEMIGSRYIQKIRAEEEVNS